MFGRLGAGRRCCRWSARCATRNSRPPIPHAGGDYHFLTPRLRPDVSFFFAWARVDGDHHRLDRAAGLRVRRLHEHACCRWAATRRRSTRALTVVASSPRSTCAGTVSRRAHAERR
ncbi:MAG: hypothetical protein MZW92_36510 [Comamonadaceae bacterium]|nr:hypothetical protein [Comamonadaceae bacterium]